MEKVYRKPIMWANGCCRDVTIEPNPFGDPYTVKITIPMEVTPELAEAFGEKYAWAILPRDMFSADVNGMTS
jgi:hypothetical protein